MTAINLAAIVCVVFVVLPASGVRAQSASTSSTAAAPAGVRDPGDPKAAVPAAAYTSAFRRYRPNADAEVGAWRELNDHVGRIGGWRVYGREASPESASPAKPAGTSPAPTPTHGHNR